MKRLEIDLNVRIGRKITFSGFEELNSDSVELLEEVEVYESESGYANIAKVVGIDYINRLIYVEIEWDSNDL